MKITLIISIGIICLIIGYSCTYISDLNKETEVITKEYNINEVSQIIANASCRLILSNGTNSKLRLYGQQHLLENYHIENSDGTLRVWHTTNVIQKDKLVEITIPANSLKQIIFNKPCEITCTDQLNIDKLTLIMNGSSEFTESDLYLTCNILKLYCYGKINTGTHILTGNTKELHLFLEGRIKVDAVNLLSGLVDIVNKSSYDCYVNVRDRLNVKTFSSGNTYYIGNAIVEHERIKVPYLQNTGELIKLD